MINEKIICAGFGGQGVMLIGQLLTYAGMIEDKEVSWLPSYGPEMRGGTANCSVIVSEKKIGSPVINDDATAVIVMNLPSLDKFESDVVKGGNLFINSSLIDKKATKEDIDVYYIPANEIAIELGNSKVANLVILGAYLEVSKVVKPSSVMKALEKIFGEGKKHLLGINEKALLRGAEVVKNK